jgi:hypothetical protein
VSCDSGGKIAAHYGCQQEYADDRGLSPPDRQPDHRDDRRQEEQRETRLAAEGRVQVDGRVPSAG